MWFTVVSDYLLELGLLPTGRYLPAVTGSSSLVGRVSVEVSEHSGEFLSA